MDPTLPAPPLTYITFDGDLEGTRGHQPRDIGRGDRNTILSLRQVRWWLQVLDDGHLLSGVVHWPRVRPRDGGKKLTTWSSH